VKAILPVGTLLAAVALATTVALAAPLGSAGAGEPAPSASEKQSGSQDADPATDAPDTDEDSATTDEEPATTDEESPTTDEEPATTEPESPSSSPPSPRPSVDPQVAAEQRAREQAAAEQRAREEAAERQARAQAAAERRAAQLAAAAQRARVAWDGHGQPHRMIIVRERTIDLVTDGRLVRQAPRAGGALTLSTLDRFVPDDWLTVDGDTATVAAAIVLTPTQSLTLGGDVRAVRLAGGPTPADAAAIYTGSGRLALRAVTVDSFDPTTRQAMPAGPGRPFIVVSGGGRFEAVDSAIDDLGTVPTDPAPRAGLTLGETSTGSLVHTTLRRNSIGLKLDRTDGVRLEGVTVSESVADGLVLRGDRATTLIGVEADGNGGNGVVVTGPSSDRRVTGISASGNTLFGLAVVGQTGTRLGDIATGTNRVGGVRVSWSTDVAISDLTSTTDPIGIYTHVGSARIAIDRARISGARRGVHMEKTTRGLDITASTITGASITGISVGGHELTLNQVVVIDSAAAMRVENGAGEVTADGLTVTGGQQGVVALPSTRHVVLRRLAADGVGHAALRTFSPDLQLIDGRISGSTTGIDAGAATVVAGVTIDEVDQGIRVRSPNLVDIDNVDISALSVGINVAPGSPVRLAGSHVDALEAVRGELIQDGANDLSLPPFTLIGAIGIPLILLTVILDQIRVVRQRGIGPSRRRSPPELTVTADMFSWSKRESEHTVARPTEPRAQNRGRRGRALAGRRTRRTATSAGQHH
jgi:hypothetical protein